VTLGGTSWEKAKRHPTLGKNVVVGAGAKILGPIIIGDNARVGSNSVVVKDVPAGATVVGIPGRIVIAKDDVNSEKRRAMAEKIGFDAYGQHHGQLPDPVTQALDRILDHLHAVDERLALQDRLLHSDTRMAGGADKDREPVKGPKSIKRREKQGGPTST